MTLDDLIDLDREQELRAMAVMLGFELQFWVPGLMISRYDADLHGTDDDSVSWVVIDFPLGKARTTDWPVNKFGDQSLDFYGTVEAMIMYYAKRTQP